MNYIDQNSVESFVDQNSITQFIDQVGNLLGLGGGTTILGDRVLDNGLTVLSTEGNAMWLCSAEPTDDYPTAIGLRLASKSGAPFGAPAATANGSAVTSVAITTGSGLAGGTCTHWAAVDSVNSRVLAHGPLDASGSIAISQVFALPSFTIEVLAHG
jgi:hypothetical protein